VSGCCFVCARLAAYSAGNRLPCLQTHKGRAGVPMEVMGLMLGEFVDDYTVKVSSGAPTLEMLRLQEPCRPTNLVDWHRVFEACCSCSGSCVLCSLSSGCNSDCKQRLLFVHLHTLSPTCCCCLLLPTPHLQVVDVFAMPQSGTGVSVEAVDPVFQTKMLDMLKQVGR